MPLPLRHIALISQTPQLSLAETAQISAALQKQIMRDFTPIWNIQATVDAFADVNHIEKEYWPILIRDDINANAAGVHSDSHGKPFALVEYDFDMTSFYCSHECLEMLADPYGCELIAADSLESGQGQVNYLLEICDPCQHPANGYSVNNFLVSDFYTPHYFDPTEYPGVRYCFSGNITRPKQVLPGGYVSWQLPDQTWWQAQFPKEGFIIISKGMLDRPPLQGWREVIDRNTKEPLYKLESSFTHNEKRKSRSAQQEVSFLTRNKENKWTKYLHKNVVEIIAKSTAVSTNGNND